MNDSSTSGRPGAGTSAVTRADATDYVESPIGLVEIGGSPCGITSLYFVEARRAGESRPVGEALLHVEEAVRQVSAYFAGTLREFDLPVVLNGTDFQKLVWLRLAGIPFGSTIAYGELARSIGRPNAVRAVGSANGSNPVSLILPCHRVIGSDGSLTGYGGGLWRKEWLLAHEGCTLL